LGPEDNGSTSSGAKLSHALLLVYQAGGPKSNAALAAATAVKNDKLVIFKLSGELGRDVCRVGKDEK